MSLHETKLLPPGREVKALPPASPKRHRWAGILWLLLFAAAGYVGYRYYQASQQKKAAADAAQAATLAHRAVSIAATATRRADLPVYLRGLGTVTAFNTVNVKSRVDGPLVKVNFKEGEFVHGGDVLVEIDPRTFQVQVEQAQGQLARDQAQINDAKVNLARYQKLWDEGVIAKQQLDTQAAQVGQFQGAIEADQAAIDTAKLNLSFTNVTAPISGRIGLRLVDAGNMVHASDANPLVVITQMQPIAVLFTIPADSLQPVLAKLRANAKLPVDAYDRADRNKIATGSLLTVDNQIDSNTGTSRLKAVFDNTDSALFPNQFVNCRLLLDTKHGVVLIPAPAVERGPQGAYVYLVKPDHTATMRTITLGITEGNDVEVSNGLAVGDIVVIDGQDKLQEGSNVDIRPDSGSPAQAGTPAPPSKPAPAGTPAGRGRK
ncbi:MAG TPA: MdtA/MuxA family multidrug efflux RND transporter periplasmic adaptor subunit [Bryobacteraceae bacterium]|nr:MdtA/MuxA family multidrug efflux RND transporter periplasmic adaptor subunit [Bryobacteraceae bacterium]